MENLKKDMEEYERTHPSAVYEDLTEEFGTPIDTFFLISVRTGFGLSDA